MKPFDKYDTADKTFNQDDTTGAADVSSTVGTLLPADDRLDPEHEPERMTIDEWTTGDYYAVKFIFDPGDAAKAQTVTVTSFEEYCEIRDYIHDRGFYITCEVFQTRAEHFKGLLTYDSAEGEFEGADDNYLEIKSFPNLSATAKIKTHDTVVLAADTGAGKSSLMLNFINDLNDQYPVIYINLEMDKVTILRRLVSIRTGMELDRIEGYKKDDQTRQAVNGALRAITSRKPLQILEDVYFVEDLEKVIEESTEDREEPTIVVIDHSLLLRTKQKTGSRYERFTRISEELRRISRRHNIILFSLLQQSRAGKQDDAERPTNSSLKESGSWENDSTHILFLWWDPSIRRKKIIITKNRGGDGGDFILDYWKKTQIYIESSQDTRSESKAPSSKKSATSARDKRREKLSNAYEAATITTNGKPSLHDIAEAAGASTSTILSWIKEFGGFTIDGKQIEPAGIDNAVEYTGFVRMTLSEEEELQFPVNGNLNYFG